VELSLESVRASGGFTGAPIKREITWEQGGESYTADVYIRRLSYHSAISDARSLAGDADMAASRISQCVCDENGAPVFRISDVTGITDDGSPVMDIDEDGNETERGALSHALTFALLTAIGEVNELGKPKAGT